MESNWKAGSRPAILRDPDGLAGFVSADFRNTNVRAGTDRKNQKNADERQSCNGFHIGRKTRNRLDKKGR